MDMSARPSGVMMSCGPWPPGIEQAAHPGGGDRQRPAARRLEAQVELCLVGPSRRHAAAFSASSSALSCADPRCSICRDPRRDDHTTCTAVAPDLVLAVLTYGTRQLYGPPLVRKFGFSKAEERTARSLHHATGNPRNPS